MPPLPPRAPSATPPAPAPPAAPADPPPRRALSTALLLVAVPFVVVSSLLLPDDGPPASFFALPPRSPPFSFPAPPAGATPAEAAAFRYWDSGVPAPCSGAPAALLAASASTLPPACAPGSSGAWRSWFSVALSSDCQYVGAPASRRFSLAAPPANASALLLFAVGASGAGALHAPLAAWSLSRWAAQFGGRVEVQLLVVGAVEPPAALAGGAHGAVTGLDPTGGVWGAWQEGVTGALHRLESFPWVVLASDGAAGPLTWFPDVLAAAGGGSDDAPPAAFYTSFSEGACCAAGAQVLAFSGANAARPLWREFWQKLPAAAAAPGCGSPLPLLPRGVPPARAGDAAEAWAFCIASDARQALGAGATLGELRRTFVPFYSVGALAGEFGDDAEAAVAYVKSLWFGSVVEPCKGANGGWGLPRDDDVVV